MQIIAFCCDTEYHITRGVVCYISPVDSLKAPYSISSQISLMAAQTNIPPDVTDPDKALIFHELDTELNSVILYSLLHGMYIHSIPLPMSNHGCT